MSALDLAATPEALRPVAAPTAREPLRSTLSAVADSLVPDSPAFGSAASTPFTTGDGRLNSFGGYLHVAARPQLQATLHRKGALSRMEPEHSQADAAWSEAKAASGPSHGSAG